MGVVVIMHKPTIQSFWTEVGGAEVFTKPVSSK